MRATIAVIPRAFLIFSAMLAPLLAQTPGSQRQQPEFIRQGQQLMRERKLDDALALYLKTLQTSTTSVPANIAAGSVLDLKGQGDEARKYFAKASDVADSPEHRAMAQRAMAISYAFEGDCKKTVEYEQKVFDFYGSVKNFFQQGEIADEAARVCIDSGDLDAAYHWYQVGHDTGMKEPDIKPARVDLWEFPLGARAGPHRCPAWESSRSAEARRCREGHPRQGHKSRTGAIPSLLARLCRILCGRL